MSDADAGRDAARARLEAVRERFAARLAERIGEIAVCVEQARAGEIPVTEALVLAHRLAGTAGSYGHADAGEHARRLEQALQGLENGGGWEEVERSLAQLRALAR